MLCLLYFFFCKSKQIYLKMFDCFIVFSPCWFSRHISWLCCYRSYSFLLLHRTHHVDLNYVSPVHRCLGVFQYAAITNSATINTYFYFFEKLQNLSLELCLEVSCPGPSVNAYIAFSGGTKFSSIRGVPFAFLQSLIESLIPHSLATSVCCEVLNIFIIC